MEPNAPQPFTPGQTPQAAPTPVVTGGRKMNKGVIIGIVVAAIVVVAGLAWGAYALFFSATPEMLLKDAVKNLSQEKSLAAKAEIVGGSGEEQATFSGDVAFAIDPSNDKNGELIIGFGESSQRITLSLLVLDKTLFLKGTELQNFAPILAAYANGAATPQQYASLLKNLNDKWFEVTEEELTSLAETSGSQNVESVSPQDIKRVLEIYDQKPFVVIDKVLADEVIDGTNTAHFTVKVDKEKLVAFLEAVKAANLASIKVTSEDITKVKEDAETNTATVDLWIARDTKKFKQIRIASGPSEGGETKITLTMLKNLPTFDKFERPAGAVPISQLLSLMFGASFDPSSLDPSADLNLQ